VDLGRWTRAHFQSIQNYAAVRASEASEPRERSEPAQRRARERVGGSGGAKPPGLIPYAILLQPAVEGAPAHAKLFGGEADIAAVTGQHLFNEDALGFFER
jgi:hypothetical protein